MVLETYTGQMAFDQTREDPELVGTLMITIILIIYFLSFLPCFQATHTEDHRTTIEDFLTLADTSLGRVSDRIVVTTLYNIVKKSLVRHGARASSAGVCIEFTSTRTCT